MNPYLVRFSLTTSVSLTLIGCLAARSVETSLTGLDMCEVNFDAHTSRRIEL